MSDPQQPRPATPGASELDADVALEEPGAASPAADDVRTSNRLIRSRAAAVIASGYSRNRLPYGARSYMSRTRFSATVNSLTTPSTLRSSGT